MNQANSYKIIQDYIKAIDSSQFQDFCDRLLLKLFPDDYTSVRAGGPRGDMKNDGYCFRKRKFFQAHASRGEKISNIKSKIKTDLDGCLAKQRDVEEFIYLTNDTLVGDVQTYVDGLRPNYPNTNIITWGPNELAIKIATQSKDDIEFIIDRQLGATNNYYVQINSEEQDYGIIQEIFDEFSSRLTQPKKLVVSPNSDKLLKLQTKIQINFSKKAHEILVKDFFSNNWRRKDIVERFIQIQSEINDERILALKEYIQTELRKITNNVNISLPLKDSLIFDKIAISLLPPGKTTNPEYKANAKAIVLYFFEICDIGKKTKDENNILQASIFDV